jgi:molybdopterin molybdotransferase
MRRIGRDHSMISFEAAQALVHAQCRTLPAESVALTAVIGRVLAQDLDSPVDLPPFDNSAMDGFALRSGGQTLAAGSEWLVLGEQAAGASLLPATEGGAVEIMTGAVLPAGLDSVVPVEHVEVLQRHADGRPARIRLNVDLPPGQNIRRAGEDCARGQRVLTAGSLITAQHLMLLAGLGIDPVQVAPRPRVALLSTGRELIDCAAQPLLPGQIRNSNGPFLAARLAAAGAELVHRETVADDAEQFDAALQRCLATGADIVLSTGAVSMGRYDFVPGSLQALGAEILFHKVAMRPGKPLLFARLAGGQLYFGLPGNPASGAVGMRFFVEPALRALLGMTPERPLRVPLAHAVDRKPGLLGLQKSALRIAEGGQLQVSLLSGQESFKTLPLLAANVWTLLPADAAVLRPGTLVDVYSLGHEAGVMFGGNAT